MTLTLELKSNVKGRVKRSNHPRILRNASLASYYKSAFRGSGVANIVCCNCMYQFTYNYVYRST